MPDDAREDSMLTAVYDFLSLHLHEFVSITQFDWKVSAETLVNELYRVTQLAEYVFIDARNTHTDQRSNRHRQWYNPLGERHVWPLPTRSRLSNLNGLY